MQIRVLAVLFAGFWIFANFGLVLQVVILPKAPLYIELEAKRCICRNTIRFAIGIDDIVLI